MKKKHIVALATALFDARPESNANKLIQWNQDCRAVIRVLQQSNPRFDTARFVAAIMRGYPKFDDFIWD